MGIWVHIVKSPFFSYVQAFKYLFITGINIINSGIYFYCSTAHISTAASYIRLHRHLPYLIGRSIQPFSVSSIEIYQFQIKNLEKYYFFPFTIKIM